jgi:DNA-binding IclR family transcriptional regulator
LPKPTAGCSRLTPRILMLASAYLASNSISDILQPAVERLAAEVGEACSAAILDGDDVIKIARRAEPRSISPRRSAFGCRRSRARLAGCCWPRSMNANWKTAWRTSRCRS